MSISTSTSVSVQSAQLAKAGDRPPHPGPYALQDESGFVWEYEITRRGASHMPPTLPARPTPYKWVEMTTPQEGSFVADAVAVIDRIEQWPEAPEDMRKLATDLRLSVGSFCERRLDRMKLSSGQAFSFLTRRR